MSEKAMAAPTSPAPTIAILVVIRETVIALGRGEGAAYGGTNKPLIVISRSLSSAEVD